MECVCDGIFFLSLYIFGWFVLFYIWSFFANQDWISFDCKYSEWNNCVLNQRVSLYRKHNIIYCDSFLRAILFFVFFFIWLWNCEPMNSGHIICEHIPRREKEIEVRKNKRVWMSSTLTRFESTHFECHLEWHLALSSPSHPRPNTRVHYRCCIRLCAFN